MTAERRERLKRLIVDAERLMRQARRESRDLVESAEQRASALVNAATQLHHAADREASEIRASADAYRAQTESEVRALLDDAHASHRTAIEEARRMTGEQPDSRRMTDDPVEPDTADEIVREAREKADHILRVARSEAVARADETLENARRLAAQIDDDARRRNDVAEAQHRATQRHMRDEQMELATRIAELKAELHVLEGRRDLVDDEARAGRPTSDIDGPEPTEDQGDIEAAWSARLDGDQGPGPEDTGRPDDIADTSPVEADFDRAIRRIRRRA